MILARSPPPLYLPPPHPPPHFPPLQFRPPKLRYFHDLRRLNFDPLRLNACPPRADLEPKYLPCLAWYPPCPRCPPCPPCFAIAVLMERATARMIEKKVFMVLEYSLLPTRVG